MSTSQDCWPLPAAEEVRILPQNLGKELALTTPEFQASGLQNISGISICCLSDTLCAICYGSLWKP